MSDGLGQVFAHEICLSQSWTNFSYASEKGKLCRVFFRENVLNSIFSQFQGEKTFSEVSQHVLWTGASVCP